MARPPRPQTLTRSMWLNLPAETHAQVMACSTALGLSGSGFVAAVLVQCQSDLRKLELAAIAAKSSPSTAMAAMATQLLDQSVIANDAAVDVLQHRSRLMDRNE